MRAIDTGCQADTRSGNPAVQYLPPRIRIAAHRPAISGRRRDLRKVRGIATHPSSSPSSSSSSSSSSSGSDPTERPVRAVVFDFGGVIITPITTGITVLAERNGTEARAMLEVLIGPDETGDHPWHRAERGELTVAEIQASLSTYASAAGIELAGDEIDVLLVPTYSINATVVARIRSLRKEGIRTGLLTNTFAEFRPTLERDLDLEQFDAIVESYAVGARKPEPGIYDAMATALGVDHAEIVYLDDFAQNLPPAHALGWRTIHVTDVASALDELDRVIAARDSGPAS